MSWVLSFRPEAADEVQEIYDYYESKRIGLGEQFLSAIDSVLEVISTNPRIFPERLPEIRSKALSRFPYLLFYSIQGKTIHVLAIIHGSRDLEWMVRRLDP